MIFGGVDCEQARRAASPAEPIVVFARGAFGGVHVETASEAARGGDRDRDDRDDD